MDPITAVLAALVGYLSGSISFARVITKLAAPRRNIADIKVGFDSDESSFQVDAVSATKVAVVMGSKFGFLTFVLDILKIAIPTFIVKQLYPDPPYYLIVASAGPIGHNWPVWHRFKGGGGFSAMYGGLLVIDWVGFLVTNLAGLIISGLLLRNLFGAFNVALWLLIPWFWFRTHDLAYVAYAIAVNVIIAIALIPDFRRYYRLWREGRLAELTGLFERHGGMWGAMAKAGTRLGMVPDRPAKDEEQDSN
jgi:glycerol-3-phosphate acyltransferase PlsY